jgi:hypothetical protein
MRPRLEYQAQMVSIEDDGTQRAFLRSALRIFCPSRVISA